jgi:rhodanese-related sulfurtransferase
MASRSWRHSGTGPLIGRQTVARLVVVGILGALTLVAAGCGGTEEAVSAVDVSEAAALVAEEPELVVLDVRTPAEFAAGHLPGAVNLDVESADFAARVAELPTDEAYLVYCRTDNRSGVATQQMAELGFDEVYDVQGGIEAWVAAGGPVE